MLIFFRQNPGELSNLLIRRLRRDFILFLRNILWRSPVQTRQKPNKKNYALC